MLCYVYVGSRACSSKLPLSNVNITSELMRYTVLRVSLSLSVSLSPSLSLCLSLPAYLSTFVHTLHVLWDTKKRRKRGGEGQKKGKEREGIKQISVLFCVIFAKRKARHGRREGVDKSIFPFWIYGISWPFFPPLLWQMGWRWRERVCVFMYVCVRESERAGAGWKNRRRKKR